MFCVYEKKDGKWLAEYLENAKLKFTATGDSPTDAMFNLYNLIGKEDDETGNVAETDGSESSVSSDSGQPPNCSDGVAIDWTSGKRSG